jgi:hypothetical protein
MAIDQRFQQRRQAKPVHKKRNYATLAVSIIILVVIFSIVYTGILWLLSITSVSGLSGPTNVTLSSTTPSVFSIGGNEYAIGLVPGSTSSGSAIIEITKDPAFVNPTMRVVLITGNATRINASGGKYANVEIELYSIASGSIKAAITPLAPTLQLLPDSSRISYAQTSISPLSASQTGNAPALPTTTIASTTTTTVSQAATDYDIAISALERNHWYPLATNLTKMYGNSGNCTSLQYNNTYYGKFAMSPTGAATYQNVTAVTPYKMTFSMTNSSAIYNAVYSTYSTGVPSGPALFITINVTANTVIANGTIGLWQGLSYLNIKSIYNTAATYTGSCGILIASAP